MKDQDRSRENIFNTFLFSYLSTTSKQYAPFFRLPAGLPPTRTPHKKQGCRETKEKRRMHPSCQAVQRRVYNGRTGTSHVHAFHKQQPLHYRQEVSRLLKYRQHRQTPGDLLIPSQNSIQQVVRRKTPNTGDRRIIRMPRPRPQGTRQAGTENETKWV